MDASVVIAAFALLVSLVSAWISYRSYRYSVSVKEEELHLAFSREKSEFLVRIDRARKSFDGLEHRLRGQIARIVSGSESEMQAFAVEVQQLRSDLAHLEGCKRQVWSLWDETYGMSQGGLAHHKPRFLGLIEDDERFANAALERCVQIEAAITNAGKSFSIFVV